MECQSHQHDLFVSNPESYLGYFLPVLISFLTNFIQQRQPFVKFNLVFIILKDWYFLTLNPKDEFQLVYYVFYFKRKRLNSLCYIVYFHSVLYWIFSLCYIGYFHCVIGLFSLCYRMYFHCVIGCVFTVL